MLHMYLQLFGGRGNAGTDRNTTGVVSKKASVNDAVFNRNLNNEMNVLEDIDIDGESTVLGSWLPITRESDITGLHNADGNTYTTSDGSKLVKSSKSTVEEVSVGDILTFQNWVVKEKLESIHKSSETSSKLPWGYKYKGRVYLADGNHRVTTEILEGKRNIKMKLYEVTKK